MKNTLKYYTVNVVGNCKGKTGRYKSYSNGEITAIEIPAYFKQEAKKIAKRFGKILFCFE